MINVCWTARVLCSTVLVVLIIPFATAGVFNSCLKGQPAAECRPASPSLPLWPDIPPPPTEVSRRPPVVRILDYPRQESPVGESRKSSLGQRGVWLVALKQNKETTPDSSANYHEIDGKRVYPGWASIYIEASPTESAMRLGFRETVDPYNTDDNGFVVWSYPHGTATTSSAIPLPAHDNFSPGGEPEWSRYLFHAYTTNETNDFFFNPKTGTGAFASFWPEYVKSLDGDVPGRVGFIMDFALQTMSEAPQGFFGSRYKQWEKAMTQMQEYEQKLKSPRAHGSKDTGIAPLSRELKYIEQRVPFNEEDPTENTWRKWQAWDIRNLDHPQGPRWVTGML
ncbi:MAG: hypothetical protein M1825_001050 [Sarcosagium campestre]|nr:MAG: hypothetical protein M1825_001050 [Sarcosagium campestre]